jgi:hypothetical protein
MKIILYFLAALLVLFVIQGIFFGVYMFMVVVKYLIIAGMFAGVMYLITKKKKE